MVEKDSCTGALSLQLELGDGVTRQDSKSTTRQAWTRRALDGGGIVEAVMQPRGLAEEHWAAWCTIIPDNGPAIGGDEGVWALDKAREDFLGGGASPSFVDQDSENSHWQRR